MIEKTFSIDIFVRKRNAIRSLAFLLPKVIFIFLMLFSFSAIAQQENNWCFGDSAGLNFNSGFPVPFISSNNSREASASISDTSGSLLFSAGAADQSGYMVAWDRTNAVMQNGDSIIGNESTTNGLLIIPMPGDTSKYYLFSSNTMSLHVNSIDMNGNGGHGTVIQKNILICDTAIGEKLIAVKHANGRDWWIITHYADYYFAQAPNNLFVKFLVTPFGISAPMYQPIGTMLYGWGGYFGEMETSRAGNKIAFCGSSPTTMQANQYKLILDVFDFDRCTGQLSNYLPLGQTLTATFQSSYGCSFSPDGKVLYASSTSRLYQYDLTSANIASTALIVWNYWTNNNWIGQQQLAPDGKIYIATYFFNPANGDDTLFDTTNMYLTVVANPNLLGTGCSVVPFSVYLGGRKCYYGLPNMPNYNLGKISGSVCDTIIARPVVPPSAEPYSFGIFPNPSNGSFQINSSFSDIAQFHLYDLLGRKVVETISLPNGNAQTFLNFSLANGAYIYSINSGDELLYQGKLIISN